MYFVDYNKLHILGGGFNMAKYEKKLKGNFDELLDYLHEGILKNSSSANYENGSDITRDDIKLAVRVYERYSMAGSNRVSLNITILAKGEDLFVSAITSGGSQAVFFKINTIGEETFLDIFIDLLEKYILQN